MYGGQHGYVMPQQARMEMPTGPAIHHYMTQQQNIATGSSGGLEFRDCQNPDASDGYVVGPNEKVATCPMRLLGGLSPFINLHSWRAVRQCSCLLCSGLAVRDLNAH